MVAIRWLSWFVLVVVCLLTSRPMEAAESLDRLAHEYHDIVRPLVERLCTDCHAPDAPEGELDLERFGSFDAVRRDPAPWQSVAKMVRQGEMPPEGSEELAAEEKQALLGWLDRYLEAEALASAGDPGPVVLRRLNNAEYTYAIRDLTGVAIDPAREFPVDGAAGEGFTNTGGALAMSTALVEKYLAAAKEVASHAVLTPEGVRFSLGRTRREWSNELLSEIRVIYLRHTTGAADMSRLNRWDGLNPLEATEADGKVELVPYFRALVVHRERLLADAASAEGIAEEEGINAKYFSLLARMLVGEEPASPLVASLRTRWREASGRNVRAIVRDIRKWQEQLWRFQTVGQFGTIRPWQVANNPRIESLALGGRIVAGEGEASPEMVVAYDDFRRYFPANMCYPRIVPVDEVVTLVLLHREDGELRRLMLSDEEGARLDRLWDELHFVSEDALVSVEALEQLLEYATQDSTPALFDPMREPIARNAARHREQVQQAEPKQLQAVVDLARRAYRRPLEEREESDLRALYGKLRSEKVPHDEAIRLVLARVLVAPEFLYRLEKPGPGSERGRVSDWELATRLSLFLWSSIPDDRLLELAGKGELSRDEVLRGEVARMLRDPKAERMAVEFGCQWLHVRGFDQFDEKSERHFPEFAELKGDMYEETVRMWGHMIREDASLLDLITGDYTFLNERLAKFYGVPNVTGPDWRKVDGVGEYGRGGILTHATVLATQSGASRTSPILRGNWLAETMLGERLPRPPKDVPTLPDDLPEGLTERELIELHAKDPSCAKCHVRIDPYGFALEGFDAIGRRRTTDGDGEPLDLAAILPDGAKLDGHESVKIYLSTARRDDVVRQFCRKLLGYALGRSVQLSDEPLLAEMQQKLAANGYRFSVAVEAIVLSDQFRQIRGRDEIRLDPAAEE